MAHLPVNHPMLRLWRTLAWLAGLYVLVFGIVGVVETAGTPFFGRQDTVAMGLQTNRAFAVLSIVVGAIVLIGAMLGRNLDRWINLTGGVVFLGAGMVMLTVLRTGANFLNFTVGTCVVSYLLGMIMLTAGLYGRVGPAAERHAEEAFRHGGRDPENHTWQREREGSRR